MTIDERWLMSRRALLGGLAVAGISPFIHVPKAHAAGAIPKRFILCYVPEGMWSSAPRPVGNASSLTLANSVLSPLEAFKSKVTVLDRLSNDMAASAVGKLGDGHHRNVPTMVTGVELIAG